MARSKEPATEGPPQAWSSRHVLAALRRPDTYKTADRCDVLLVRHDADCAQVVEGKAYAQLPDSFAELCADRGLAVSAVAVPYSSLTGDLARHSPVSFNRAAFVDGRLSWAVGLVRGRERRSQWVLRRRARIWRRVLDGARPSHVIGIEPDAALCRVGAERGITVCDLQHGLILDELPQYGAAHQQHTDPRDLPTCYLCWDEPSAATLRKWATAKGIDVRVVGNPWFSRFAFPTANDSLVSGMRVPKEMIHDPGRPTALVSLQWGMSQEYSHPDFNGVMVDALEQTIVGTAGSYNWLLRLHPLQRLGRERERALDYLSRTFGDLESVEWSRCSELPLPLVLQHSDVHVTDSSTTFVEASWMGIRSALTSVHIGPGKRWASLDPEARTGGLAEVMPHDVEALRRWLAVRSAEGREAAAVQRQRESHRALEAFVDEIAATAALRR